MYAFSHNNKATATLLISKNNTDMKQCMNLQNTDTTIHLQHSPYTFYKARLHQCKPFIWSDMTYDMSVTLMFSGRLNNLSINNFKLTKLFPQYRVNPSSLCQCYLCHRVVLATTPTSFCK